MTARRTGVAVLGTPFRGDDAVGPLVGERLRARGLEVLDCRDEPTRLIEPFTQLDVAVIVDAVRSGSAVGTVHVVEAAAGRLPADLALASTHAVGVGEALELGRALGRAPRRVVLVGVEGRAFGMGDPLTPEVEQALDAAADAVLVVLGDR
ncbi:MAG: hydrogenase maturation protease [Gaiella sp.]